MPSDHTALGGVLLAIVCHPVRELLWKWNYKSAITSAAVRGMLFFTSNLSAGLDAATAALGVEVVFRFATAGFYGAMTQAFRRVDPPWMGTMGAVVILRALAHGLEWIVHWSRGTANLSTSIVISIAFTVISTRFNLFAMRRGVLVVGERDSGTLIEDLVRLPRIIRAFF